MNTPYIVPSTKRRDLLIGIGIALLIVAVAGWFIADVKSELRKTVLTGTIVAKIFTPNAEHQITFGKDGTHMRQIKGLYVFEVCVKTEPPSENADECKCEVRGRHFLVTVNEKAFELHNVGDTFRFSSPIEIE